MFKITSCLIFLSLTWFSFTPSSGSFSPSESGHVKHIAMLSIPAAWYLHLVEVYRLTGCRQNFLQTSCKTVKWMIEMYILQNKSYAQTLRKCKYYSAILCSCYQTWHRQPSNTWGLTSLSYDDIVPDILLWLLFLLLLFLLFLVILQEISYLNRFKMILLFLCLRLQFVCSVCVIFAQCKDKIFKSKRGVTFKSPQSTPSMNPKLKPTHLFIVPLSLLLQTY